LTISFSNVFRTSPQLRTGIGSDPLFKTTPFLQL
jgi:hypothetical protein